jgi:hypothetical protein
MSEKLIIPQIKKPDFTPFNELKVSLMVHVILLEGKCNKEAIFEMLPISLVQLNQKKNKKVKKIPHFPEYAGKNIALSYINAHRGIFRKPFKNNTSAVMCLKDKNMAIKYFDDKFQLAGATNAAHVEECLTQVMADLKKVQDIIDYMMLNHEKTQKTYRWIVNMLDGPEGKLNPKPELNNDVDEKIANFMLSFYDEFNNWIDYDIVLRWILKTNHVITPDFTIKKTITVMTNYNYNLGFKINRTALVKQVIAKTNFDCLYDNSKQYHVKLLLPYERDESFEGLKKKKKKNNHSLQIYKSGNVTQSGPNENLMRPVYEYFRKFICEVRHLIDNDKVNDVDIGLEDGGGNGGENEDIDLDEVLEKVEVE